MGQVNGTAFTPCDERSDGELVKAAKTYVALCALDKQVVRPSSQEGTMEFLLPQSLKSITTINNIQSECEEVSTISLLPPKNRCRLLASSQWSLGVVEFSRRRNYKNRQQSPGSSVSFSSRASRQTQ